MKKGIDRTGWTKTTFGEVCRNINTTIKSAADKGIERYVGLEHIESGSLHIKTWGNVNDGTTFTKTFKSGHVLFGKRRAYLKKAAVANFEGLCSGDILVFEANEKKIDPQLLPFLVSSDGFFDYAVKTSAGSLSPRTKFQDLAKYSFHLPPLKEQAKLAELLWAGDDVIEKYQIVENCSRLLTNVLLKDLRNTNYRNANVLLKEVLTLEYGEPLKENDRSGGDIPVYGSAGIVGWHKDFNVLGPGIIVGRKGGAGIVTWAKDNFFAIDTSFWIKYKDELMDRKFVYYLLKSMDLPSLVITTAVPGLNREDVHLKRIYKFPNKEQKEFLGKFDVLEYNIQTNEAALQQIKNVHRHLINQIFT